jgi:formylglycine-generating enzyme required for sulfatase activity
MARTRRFHIILVVIAIITVGCVLGCSKDEGVTQTDYGPGRQSIDFRNVRVSCERPRTVEFYFSLRDEAGHAVIIPGSEMHDAFQIFEFNDSKDEWEEICYTETAYNPVPAANLDMTLALILDFSNSMMTWVDTEGHRGVDEMVAGAKLVLEAMGPAHRVVVIPYYHESPVEPRVLVGPTSDKDAAADSIDAFLARLQDPGGTRCWDAMYLGVSELVADSSTVMLVICLSDGFDTSSEWCIDDEVIYAANQAGVTINAVGYGEWYPDQLENLKRVAEATGGTYYEAPEVENLQEQLATVSEDLGGQYNLSYITLKPTDWIRTKIQATYGGRTGSYETWVTIEEECGGDVRIGEMSVDPAAVAPNGTATIFIRIDHTPRHVDTIRFKLGLAAGQIVVSLPAAAEGGICGGWQLTGPDGGGFYTAHGDTLLFGIAGLFARVDASGIECGQLIPFDVDNSIYPTGKYFRHPDYIVLTSDNYCPMKPQCVYPDDGAADISRNPILRWRCSDPDEDTLRYDLYLGDTSPAPLLESDIADTAYTVGPLEAWTTYYWRVDAIDEAESRTEGDEVSFTTTDVMFAGMVEVPSGTFVMGDSGTAEPERSVTLTGDFYIDATEVTNLEYATALNWALAHGQARLSGGWVYDMSTWTRFLAYSNSYCKLDYDYSTDTFTATPGYEAYPIVYVTWYGAAAYCNWMSQMAGVTPAYDHGTWQCGPGGDPYAAEGYRLPSEAEWEYAAQYDDDRAWPWGDDEPDVTRANYDSNLNYPAEVGSYPAGDSELGLADMAGNVSEWVNDFYGDYAGSAEIDPVGPASGYYRVIRGGSYWGSADNVRCAARTYEDEDSYSNGRGFRCVRKVDF